MAATYWLSFKIGPGGNGQQRYQSLLAEVRHLTSGMWWTGTGDFLVFQSDHDVDAIAQEIARVLKLDADVAVLVRDAERDGVAIGTVQDPMLYELMSYLRPYDSPPPADAEAQSAGTE